MPDVAAALRRASEAGPYFAVSTDIGGPGWLPFSDLLDSGDALGERIEHVASVLGARSGAAVEARVAASTLSLGLASRLVAPALATAALDGVVPTWSPESLWWQPVEGGPVPLAAPDPAGVAVTAADAAGALAEHVLDPVVAPLVDALAGHSLSRTVLWGNVASAVAGAARMLPAARPLAVELIGTGLLAGTGSFDGPNFWRASCCLFYRVPGGGYCGDCVLA